MGAQEFQGAFLAAMAAPAELVEKTDPVAVTVEMADSMGVDAHLVTGGTVSNNTAGSRRRGRRERASTKIHHCGKAVDCNAAEVVAG
ncbi:hypothetical protein [Chelativorans sp. YIM 93263]|uniref:hypothetical protein n=1 Tax=Chelativorans sp. YIM 93263 TaxID=2906648 RepID=UPI0023794A46|nr:hypothetical protein [Chelativorans sp. YIM 93263]